jgi:hypothetical protein
MGFRSDAIAHCRGRDTDYKVLVEGIKLIRRLARIAPLNSFLLESDFPKKNIDDLSDEEINKHIDQCKYSSQVNYKGNGTEHHRLRDNLPPDIILQNRT